VADLLVKKESNITAYIFLGGMVLTGIFILLQSGRIDSVFYNMIVVDPFAVFFKALIVLTGIFIVFFSLQSRELEEYKSRIGEYYMLLSGMVVGMMLMVSSTNLLLMYLAFELTSISSYVLVGFTKETPVSAEASMKYIVYGAVSSGVMLYGISLLIGITGATDMYGINEALNAGINQPVILNLSIVMIVVGLGFKTAVVPFHFWAPDVYQGAPISIAAILAVASKIAAFGLMVRFFLVTFMDAEVLMASGAWEVLGGVHWNMLLAGMAALSMIIGNLTALKQDNIKRMLAYSSIGHIGMILAVLMLNTEAAFYGALLHIIAHLMMKSGLFLSSGYLLKTTLSHHIDDLKGIGHKNRLLFIAFIIICLGTIGMPPLIGFVSKWFVLLAFLEARHYFGAFVVGAGSIIALIYYLRYISQAYQSVKMETKTLREELISFKSFFKNSNMMKNVIYIFTLLIIFFGLAFRVLEMPINTAIFELLNPQKYIELVLGG